MPNFLTKSFLPVFLTAFFLLGTIPATFAQSNSGSVTYAGGDGSSVEKAILIKGATEETGVKAEYAWLKEHFPGYAMGGQSLLNVKGRSYDLLEFTQQGEKKSIYFDITEYFGKF